MTPARMTIEAIMASGHMVDFVLAVLVLELAIIRLWRARSGYLLLGALPGALLLLALRSALTGNAWPWVPLWLGLSFPAHLLDLRHRLAAERS